MSRVINIRIAEQDDLPQILDLLDVLGGDCKISPIEEIEKTWHEIISYNGLSLIVGEVEGQLVSTCTLIIVPNLTRATKPYAFIENVVTLPSARGKGYASEVLNVAIDLAGSQGCYKLMLLSGEANKEAHKLYSKLGFKRDKIGFQYRY